MRRPNPLIVAVLLLALSLCGCLDSEEEGRPPTATPSAATTAPTAPPATPTAIATPTAAPTLTPAPTGTPVVKRTQPAVAALIPTDTPPPTETPIPAATEPGQQFSWTGGYSFWPVRGYEMRFDGGQTILTDPRGSMLSLAGGPEQNAGRSMEESLQIALQTINEATGTTLQAGAPYPMTVGGAAGLAADLSGAMPNGPVMGQVVTTRPAEGQTFYAFGMANVAAGAEAWTQRAGADFRRLLGSVQFFPISTALSCPRSVDTTYGYSRDNPVRIGGGAAARERGATYLGALLSPLRQPIAYEWLGSESHGDAQLDSYRVTYPQLEQPLVLYLDANRFETLFAPVGFTCWGPFPLDAP